MLFIRSTIFNIAFYIHIIFWLLVIIPLLLFPKQATRWVMVTWASQVQYLLKWICNIKIDARGLDNIPDHATIVACNHQSFLEIILLAKYLKHPLMLYKSALAYIPVFGWALKKLRFIPIVRGGRGKTIRFMLEAAKTRIEDKGQVMIFPEGTRVPAGKVVKLKQGVIAIYEGMKLPCLPVAQNAGLFWPRREWLKQPGTVIIEFLPEIEAGLDRRTFARRLHDEIMTAKVALEQEAMNSQPTPPITEHSQWLFDQRTKKIEIKSGEIHVEAS